MNALAYTNIDALAQQISMPYPKQIIMIKLKKI